MRLTVINLEACAEKLRVYDVDQKGWEQEPNGFVANARHVLAHLVKDLATKDFTDEVLVRTAIAPDSVQYSLRLLRWGRVDVKRLANIANGPLLADSYITARHVNTSKKMIPFNRVLRATGYLAQNLHDLDHEQEKGVAEEQRQDAVLRAAGLLAISALSQAGAFNFDLVEAFDTRLASLRERFGIPDPEAS
ncbi:MAG: hypothetical protein AAB459_02720 [Patescibacteria group bacterium]|jgi:hypothetical protein